MIYHEYGKTGVHLSAIGFGGMRFQDQGDVEGCASLVNAAYEAGINYFDTAPGYGKSEELYGVAFKSMLRHREERPFYVSTKSAKKQPGEVRRDLETSLKRMNLEYIDFYHCWYVLTPEDYATRKANGVLEEFEKLKDEGLIKHISVSTHLLGPDVGRMLEDYPFEGVLLGYSAMNFPFRTEGIEAAARLGRGVVVMNPLGGGMIPRQPDRFSFLKTRDDESVVEAALRFLLSDKRITVSLVGFSNTAHLEEALSAVEGLRPLSDVQVAQIKAHLNEGLDQLCTGCSYCDNCPEDVPVPKLMDAWTYGFLSGQEKEAIDRLKWHWGVMPDSPLLNACLECMSCEDACTQHLPIIERIKDLQRWAEAYVSGGKG